MRASAAQAPSRPPRVFTYILAVDSGYAPNPFHRWLTLACCKPRIRKRAAVGDWIVGITPAWHGHKLAYAMRVDDVLPFERYWRDPRFRRKRPRWTDEISVERVGDNCYEPMGDGEFRQRRCCHSHADGREHEGTMTRDLSGVNALVSRHFCYFGATAIELPDDLAFAIPGRGHRVRFDEDRRRALLAWLTRLPRGVHGDPSRFVKAGQSTGRHRRARCG